MCAVDLDKCLMGKSDLILADLQSLCHPKLNALQGK